MTAPTTWTEPRYALLALRNKTLSIRQIASEFGVSHETIRSKLHERGWKPLYVKEQAAVVDALKPPRECYTGRFQDITPAECRVVSKGVSSARVPRREAKWSDIGCAALLCTQGV